MEINLDTYSNNEIIEIPDELNNTTTTTSSEEELISIPQALSEEECGQE